MVDTIFIAALGTEIIIDEEGNGATERRLRKLQHEKSGDGHIIFILQPSLTDPNSPLLWSITKKWAALLNGAAYAFT